jgi:hypothetical protein
MAKISVPAPVDRVWKPCTTLDELHEQTRLLYESITARARRSRRRAQPHKAVVKKQGGR